MGGFQFRVPCKWQLLSISMGCRAHGNCSAQGAVNMAAALLPVEKAWLAGPFLTLLAQTGSGRQDRGRWVCFSSGCRAHGSCSASARGAVQMATAQHRVP